MTVLFKRFQDIYVSRFFFRLCQNIYRIFVSHGLVQSSLCLFLSSDYYKEDIPSETRKFLL